MTSIRALLETHTQIPAILSEDGTTVSVETEDFTELCYLAGMGEEINASDLLEKNGLLVDISKKIFVELIERAHDAVHPGPPELTLTENYHDEPDVKGTDTYADEVVSREDRRVYELGQNRAAAMHYAVQIVLADIQASHGLDVAPRDLVELAEKINGFLKG